MGQSGNRPSNTTYNGIDLNNGGWIIIGILIALLIIAVVIAIIIWVKDTKIINALREFQKQSEVSAEERDLLIEYRKLNSRDKNVIISTVSSLNENNQPTDNPSKEQKL